MRLARRELLQLSLDMFQFAELHDGMKIEEWSDSFGSSAIFFHIRRFIRV